MMPLGRRWLVELARRLAQGAAGERGVTWLISRLGFVILFPAASALCLMLMLPALISERVPVWLWPVAAMYALLGSSGRFWETW